VYGSAAFESDRALMWKEGENVTNCFIAIENRVIGL
jgi:hypothetical protein